MSMIPYLVTQRPSAGDVGRTAALAALTAAWVAWWVPLHPDWAANRVLMSVYYLGFLVFSALLVARSPWFAFFCWIGYLHAYRFLTGPARYIGLIGTAAISAVAQLGGFHRPTLADWVIFAVVACLNATLVTAFIYLGAKAEEQNQARKRMIVELAGANRRLEEMMAENTGLHAQLLTQAREAGVLEERQRDGPGDPRHARPGAGRDHHPAGGRAAGARARRRPARRARRARRVRGGRPGRQWLWADDDAPARSAAYRAAGDRDAVNAAVTGRQKVGHG